ncbi:hypothetical protein IT396_02285 [Candidatus Nomurabacteria bacterium]|nr:hypothetical protein [Candidatus Nomurabacteria bacterium]
MLQNKEARLKRGALNQDFERKEGEVFYGNLAQREFDALPLRTKRKGGPARLNRILSGKNKQGDNYVFVPTYEELYRDKESFSVFVHTYELDMLSIEY